MPDHAARSNSERAAPSARVGNRFSAPQIVWNKSNRCAGERGGARVGRPRWVRILTITGGSSMAALRRRLRTGDDLQAAAAVRAVFDVDVEDPFEQPGPTQARRRALRVIACGRGCLLWRTGDDFTTQLCVRREHAMEAKNSKMDVDPSTAEELQSLLKEVMTQPKEVIEKVRKLLGN